MTDSQDGRNSIIALTKRNIEKAIRSLEIKDDPHDALNQLGGYEKSDGRKKGVIELVQKLSVFAPDNDKNRLQNLYNELVSAKKELMDKNIHMGRSGLNKALELMDEKK